MGSAGNWSETASGASPSGACSNSLRFRFARKATWVGWLPSVWVVLWPRRCLMVLRLVARDWDAALVCSRSAHKSPWWSCSTVAGDSCALVRGRSGREGVSGGDQRGGAGRFLGQLEGGIPRTAFGLVCARSLAEGRCVGLSIRGELGWSVTPWLVVALPGATSACSGLPLLRVAVSSAMTAL